MIKYGSNMQGTPAFIEKHYESLYYYHQDKKICYYCSSKLYDTECKNENSSNYSKTCIGYTKCADFIAEHRYKQKIAEAEKARQAKKARRAKYKEQNPIVIEYDYGSNKKRPTITIIEEKPTGSRKYNQGKNNNKSNKRKSNTNKSNNGSHKNNKKLHKDTITLGSDPRLSKQFADIKKAIKKQ